MPAPATVCARVIVENQAIGGVSQFHHLLFMNKEHYNDMPRHCSPFRAQWLCFGPNTTVKSKLKCIHFTSSYIIGMVTPGII